MPVLRGAVTFSRFLAELPSRSASRDAKRWLPQGLRARAFEPLDLREPEDRAAGFVELEGHDATAFEPGSVFYGEHVLFSYRIDQIRVPAAAVRAELEKWAAAFTEEQGRPPGRSEKARSRASIRQALRAQATPITRVHDVSWSLETGQLHVWATARKVVEEIQTAVETAFKVKLLALVPTAVAARDGVAEGALAPTPELIGLELPVEVDHGQA